MDADLAAPRDIEHVLHNFLPIISHQSSHSFESPEITELASKKWY